MVDAFNSTGEFKVLKETKYLTSDEYLKRGDTLVKSGHTVMVLEDGSKADVKETMIKVSVLKKKCKGEAVVALQSILTALDYYTGELDGSFGNLSDKAVRAFQKDNGLTVDGIVGSATWEKLLN
jgi:murein L,D-transpeptidase YcbB/YkuD